MRVLVTGGTGFLGSAVVRELLARGHSVRVLARAQSDAGVQKALGAEIHRGELLDAHGVAEALVGEEALVHVAGRVTFRPSAAEELKVANVEAVEVVLGEALRANLGRVLYTSSTAVLGGSDEPRVLDDAHPGDKDSLTIPYFASKVEGEKRARAFLAKGLPLVILRPSFLLGPGDVHGSSAGILVALAKRRIPGYVEGGSSYCDVRDVARTYAEALSSGNVGEVYTLAGHNLTTSAMIAAVTSLAGVPAPRRLPYRAAMALAAAEEITAGLQKRRATVTRDLIRASALYTFSSHDKAGRELSHAVRPFEEMARDTLRWAISEGKLRAETEPLRALAAEISAA